MVAICTSRAPFTEGRRRAYIIENAERNICTVLDADGNVFGVARNGGSMVRSAGCADGATDERQKRDSDEARRICLYVHLKEDERGCYMVCALSGIRFDPGTSAWRRADHYPIPWALGGRNTPDNLRPVLTKYDAEPGGHAAQVSSGIAKGKRVRRKHPPGQACVERRSAARPRDGDTIGSDGEQ